MQMLPSLHRVRFARVAALAALGVIAACAPSVASDGAADTPRAGEYGVVRVDTSVALPITLSETVVPLPSRDFLATLTTTPGASTGQVDLDWDLRSGPCMLATATAQRIGQELRVRVERRGDPAALCKTGEVVYRYTMRISSVPAGRYTVRLIEQSSGQPEAAPSESEVLVDGPPAGRP